MKKSRRNFTWITALAFLLSGSSIACARSYDRSSQVPAEAGNPAYPLTGGPNVRYATPATTTPAPYPVPAASYQSSGTAEQISPDVIAAAPPPPPPSVPYNEISVSDQQLASDVDRDSSIVGYETTSTREQVTVITYVHTYPEPIQNYSRVFWAGRYYYNIQGNFVFWDPFYGGWSSYWGPPYPLILAWNNFYPWSPYSWAIGFYGPGWYWGGVSNVGYHAHGHPPRHYRPVRPNRIDRGGRPSGPSRPNVDSPRANRKIAVPTPPSRSQVNSTRPSGRARTSTKYASPARGPKSGGSTNAKSTTRYAPPPRWNGKHSPPSWGPSSPTTRPNRSASPKLAAPRSSGRAAPTNSKRGKKPSSRTPSYQNPGSRGTTKSPSRSKSRRSSNPGYSHSPSRSRAPSTRPSSGSRVRSPARPSSGPARSPSPARSSPSRSARPRR